MFCCFILGLVESDPEAALEGFAEVVRMEPEKADWWVLVEVVSSVLIDVSYGLAFLFIMWSSEKGG